MKTNTISHHHRKWLLFYPRRHCTDTSDHASQQAILIVGWSGKPILRDYCVETYCQRRVFSCLQAHQIFHGYDTNTNNNKRKNITTSTEFSKSSHYFSTGQLNSQPHPATVQHHLYDRSFFQATAQDLNHT